MNEIGKRKSMFRSLTCYFINSNQFTALFTFLLKPTNHAALDKYNNNR